MDPQSDSTVECSKIPDRDVCCLNPESKKRSFSINQSPDDTAKTEEATQNQNDRLYINDEKKNPEKKVVTDEDFLHSATVSLMPKVEIAIQSSLAENPAEMQQLPLPSSNAGAVSPDVSSSVTSSMTKRDDMKRKGAPLDLRSRQQRRIVSSDSDEASATAKAASSIKKPSLSSRRSASYAESSSSEETSSSSSSSDSDTSSTDSSSGSLSSTDRTTKFLLEAAASRRQKKATNARPKNRARAKPASPLKRVVSSTSSPPAGRRLIKNVKEGSEEGESDESDDDEAQGHVVTSKKLQRDSHAELIAQILSRWWYILPEWPPPNYNYDVVLKENKLKLVSLEDWESADDVDESGFTKVYGISHFQGIFRDPTGRAIDLRPKENKPCYATFRDKSEEDLYALLVQALKNQLEALEKSPYRNTEEPTVVRCERDLQMDLKRAEEMLIKAKKRRGLLTSRANNIMQ